MADLSITAANVAKASNAQVQSSYPAGETITAGQVVYLKSTDSKWYKAQADGTAEEAGASVTVGIALHGSLANQPLVVQIAGTITIGGTVTVATEYVISAAAGGIAPHADLVSTNRYTRLGYGTTTGIIQLDISATGLQVP